MSAREKIGQCCLMNFRFWTDNPEEKKYEDALKVESPERFYSVGKINSTIYRAIRQYKIGAVIFFAENLSEADEAKKFIRDLNNASLDGGGLPLLFCTDQEGGNVNRVFDFTMPSLMAIRRAGNLENAFLSGQNAGALLLDYGIHVDFAPVADIALNEANPVIGIRAAGDNPAYVAEYSNAMRAGLENAGAIACAKHFPGHGDTDTDSHLGLPQIKRGYSKWKKIEAVPFKRNIDSGIPMIMSAHIQMPKIDGKKIYAPKSGSFIYPPATLSHKILTEILRGKMGFKGVVVSDAMDMQAISDNFSPTDAFIGAVNAGVNLVCHPINVYSKDDLLFLEQFFVEVEAALQDGRLDSKMLDDSVERILLLKESAGLIKISSADSDGTTDSDGGRLKITPLPQKIIPMPWQEKQNAALLSQKIESLAIRASYKSRVQIKGSDKLLVLVPHESKADWIQNYFASEKNAPHGGGVPNGGGPRGGRKFQVISYAEKDFLDEGVQQKIIESDKIIIFTQLTGYAVKEPGRWQAAFPKAAADFIKEAGRAADTVAVSTNLPYDQSAFPKKEGFGWCATYGYSAKDYRAALNVLLNLTD